MWPQSQNKQTKPQKAVELLFLHEITSPTGDRQSCTKLPATYGTSNHTWDYKLTRINKRAGTTSHTQITSCTPDHGSSLGALVKTKTFILLLLVPQWGLAQWPGEGLCLEDARDPGCADCALGFGRSWAGAGAGARCSFCSRRALARPRLLPDTAWLSRPCHGLSPSGGSGEGPREPVTCSWFYPGLGGGWEPAQGFAPLGSACTARGLLQELGDPRVFPSSTHLCTSPTEWGEPPVSVLPKQLLSTPWPGPDPGSGYNAPSPVLTSDMATSRTFLSLRCFKGTNEE